MILVDIDGVLAWGNIPSLVSLYNRCLKLGIPEERLECIETRDAFYALPQVQEHIAAIGEERYQRQLASMQWHPLYVLRHHVMEGAVPGVNYLAQRVPLRYCTARVITFNDGWNEHLARVTKLWLKEHGFPNEENVLFCNGIKAKLEIIAELVRGQKQSIILIDDSVEQLLLAFCELPKEDQGVLKNSLTLVAFGYEACPDGCPLTVIPFPDWSEVINLAVEKEFSYAKSTSE